LDISAIVEGFELVDGPKQQPTPPLARPTDGSTNSYFCWGDYAAEHWELNSGPNQGRFTSANAPHQNGIVVTNVVTF
jgi:hypothetical protein